MLRYDELVKTLLEERLEGRRDRGRRRLSLLRGLKGGCSYAELKREEGDGSRWNTNKEPVNRQITTDLSTGFGYTIS